MTEKLSVSKKERIIHHFKFTNFKIMVEVKEKDTNTTNISVDKTMDEKYNGKILFPEKHKRAIEQFKGRNLVKEIEEILEKERITK